MSDTTADPASDPDPDSEAAAMVQRSSTRRSLVAGSAGALAAVATGLAISGRVEAADGDALTVGSQNLASARTSLTGPSFVVTDNAASGSLARDVNGVITGVHGFTGNSTANRAVWGLDETPDGVGVYGQHGTTGRGTGVVANSGNGPGLTASGTTLDVALRGSGKLVLFASAGPDVAATPAQIGTLARGDDGSLWYAKGNDDWVRLAGGQRSSTFTAIEPTRVYDSRRPNPSRGPVGSGGQRRFSVRAGRDLITGAVIDANLVPADADAVSYNVTITRTLGSGFLTVAPGNSTVAKASTINWTASDQTIANAGIVKVDGDGALRVFVGGPGGSTDFLVDVSGYYA